MGFKGALSKPFAKWVISKQEKQAKRAVEDQQETLKNLVSQAANTAFGKDVDLGGVKNHTDFQRQVSVGDYETLKPYVDRVITGEEDVLWPGKPLYLCKTSGTTSGAKFIPITKASMPHHITAARNALLGYIAQTGKSSFVDGKMIFLQGSPILNTEDPIPVGRLSGIVAHYVPGYLQKNRMPTWDTNCIDDWEQKVDAIVDETFDQDMRLISGIPSWVQMYFERILVKTGKSHIKEVFPNFSLFVYGGVNFEPYRPIFNKLVGSVVPSVETYPASEGFIAFQDRQGSEGLLLNTNAGIFFEFVPADRYFEDNPPRLGLADVEVGVNYALVMSTNAGLWGYGIGDTVKFVSLNPFKIVVTGRIKHFTSAFGEHVIGEEVEKALRETLHYFSQSVREFHLAPEVNPESGLPYHEWFIEFDEAPHNMDAFAQRLDKHMQELNPYYKDLISGNILQRLIIRTIAPGGFKQMMKSRGKLGGQNKIPRLSNDRSIAKELLKWIK